MLALSGVLPLEVEAEHGSLRFFSMLVQDVGAGVVVSLGFFLLGGSTTAHDGSTTEEGALCSASSDEFQPSGATGGTVSCYYWSWRRNWLPYIGTSSEYWR